MRQAERLRIGEWQRVLKKFEVDCDVAGCSKIERLAGLGLDVERSVVGG